MTELERAPERGTLQDRANDLVAAGQIGRALSQTIFAPAAFRDKPEEAAAAIVFGDEIGLTPMQSLRSIYVIGGTPALYSRVMVALVLGAGHDIWTVEDAPGKVTVAGRRRGSTHVEEVTWTTARAQTAGYTSNKKYQSDSQSMLYARAAGDVARRIAPDVLLGVTYAVEEIELAEVETTVLSRTEPAKPARVARKSIAPPARRRAGAPARASGRPRAPLASPTRRRGGPATRPRTRTRRRDPDRRAPRDDHPPPTQDAARHARQDRDG